VSIGFGSSPAVDLLARVTILFGLGLLATVLTEGRSAAVRHFLLSVTLASGLILPLLSFAPRLELSIPWIPARMPALPAAMQGQALRPADVHPLPPPVDRAGAIREVTRPVEAGWRIPGGALAWLIGSFGIIAWALLGRLGLVRLARGATTLSDPAWLSALAAASRALGVRQQVHLCVSSKVGAPMTWGVFRPLLVLPAGCDTWSDALRRSVLLHELAHVSRRDYLLQRMAIGACAVYWFHPLAWMCARRMRQNAERACDDLVLASGTDGEAYASHLIGVARGSRELRLSGAVAIGMARPTTLEGRIVAVLNQFNERAPMTPHMKLTAAAGAAALLLVVGAVQPVRAASFPMIADASETTLPAVRVSTPPVEPRQPVVVTPTARQDSTFDRSVAASPGGLLDLDLDTGGNVTIRGWDESRVSVRVALGGADWRDVEVDVDRVSDGVRVRSRYVGRSDFQRFNNRFEIRIPSRFDVRIASGGGTLSIADVEGRFRGHTGGGGFELERLAGSAQLTTGGGEIRVSDSELSGRVSTGGGSVVLSRVRGGLRGSSGSGPVIHGESGSGRTTGTADLSDMRVDRDNATISIGRNTEYRSGSLSIEKAGGHIDLDRAPNGARVHTGGGNVTVGRSAGFVSASTGGGDVTVGPVAGSVRAGTGSGEVHVMIDKADEEQVIDVTSGTGRVIIELPRDFDGRLDLETAYTRTFEGSARITSDWDLERAPLSGWDDREGTPRRYLQASGELGTGRGRVRVRTVNGEIIIRRR
jgi:hypothetical protein